MQDKNRNFRQHTTPCCRAPYFPIECWPTGCNYIFSAWHTANFVCVISLFEWNPPPCRIFSWPGQQLPQKKNIKFCVCVCRGCDDVYLPGVVFVPAILSQNCTYRTYQSTGSINRYKLISRSKSKIVRDVIRHVSVYWVYISCVYFLAKKDLGQVFFNGEER